MPNDAGDDPSKTIDAAVSSRPNLLGIPQGLRDAIFSYIYDTFDDSDIVSKVLALLLRDIDERYDDHVP
jgi:hypothetical protein